MKLPVPSLLFAAIAFAQPSFEIASIKLNVSGDRSSVTRRGENSLVLRNWPLRNIVLKAYDLKNYALNAPDWLSSRNFDINAKASGEHTMRADALRAPSRTKCRAPRKTPWFHLWRSNGHNW
jgi:Protein of unknown function (DUF3738)